MREAEYSAVSASAQSFALATYPTHPLSHLPITLKRMPQLQHPGPPNGPKEVPFLYMRPQSRYHLCTWSPRDRKAKRVHTTYHTILQYTPRNKEDPIKPTIDYQNHLFVGSYYKGPGFFAKVWRTFFSKVWL